VAPSVMLRKLAAYRRQNQLDRITDRNAEAQQFRASGLNLVIAAIVFWNSTYIADAIAHLRATEQSVPDAWLAHTSPLSWEHISFSGDFLWERAAALPMQLRSARFIATARHIFSRVAGNLTLF
jgi:Tn3 transposase DDE domain